MRDRGRLMRIVSGGVTDAGLASLATFIMGLVATRLLTPSDLGVYAIFFTAFLTGTEIPARGVFTPAEVVCVSHPVGQRVRVLRRSLRAGNLAAVGAALCMLAAVAASWQIASPGTVLALTSTSMVAAYVSPIQDHVRRVLIKDDTPWQAAAISLVQLIAIITGSIGMWSTGMPVAALPFGALAIANAVSLAFGLARMRYLQMQPFRSAMTLRSLASSGRFLVVSQLVPTAAAFAAATIISRLAGAAELGYAEAARLAAQPILVAALGLVAVFEPRFMEAAGRRDEARAQRSRSVFYAMLFVAGAGYLLVAGWAWPLNPMVHLMPEAYVLPWLVAAYIIANLASGATYGGWSELAGGGHEPQLARINPVASVSWLVAAGTAGLTGAYARPLGLFIQSVARHLMYWPEKRRMYGTAPTITNGNRLVEAEAPSP